MSVHTGFVPPDFVKDEPVWIVGLLEHVEPEIPRLLNGRPGVFQGRLEESFSVFRFYVNINAHYDRLHISLLSFSDPNQSTT